jgi:antibiotic biosynthesis monooxygenase (ABM) superfamily enzyme
MHLPVTSVTQFERRRNPVRPARPQQSTGPARYKLALLTWVSAYALLTLLLALLGPAIASWPLAARTLLVSFVMVGTLTWVIMPRVTRTFRAWLNPAR